MATLVTGLFNSRSGADPAVEGPVDYGDSRDDIILLLSDALVVANSLFTRQPCQVHQSQDLLFRVSRNVFALSGEEASQ